MSKAIIIDWGSWQLNILWKSEVSKYGSNMLRLALKVIANIFVHVEMDPLGKCKGLRKLWQPRMMILAGVSSVDKKKRKIALAKDSKEKVMIVEKQKQESLN